MSDLHIDSNQWGTFETETLLTLLKEEKIDHLHLAGDISNHYKEISLPFLEELKQEIDLTWNLGNHDMLDLSEEEIKSLQFLVKDLDNHLLLSFDGWYDYAFLPQIPQEVHEKNKRNYWFDRRIERPASDPMIMQEILQQLEKHLKVSKKEIIVAMHFVPHSDYTLKHPYFERFNAFLGSPHFHELFRKYPVKEVVFGHTHHRFPTQIIDGITYHCRPLGYQREWELIRNFLKIYPHYQIDKPYQLHKQFAAIRDQEEFIHYRKDHLKDEFRRALTIIEG